MLSIKKITVGIRPPRRIFEISSNWGQAFDKIIALEGTKNFRDVQFAKYTVTTPEDRYTLFTPEKDIVFTFSNGDITFTVSAYETTKHIDIEDFLQKFADIWRAINGVLNLRSIQFIGCVAEHRTSSLKESSTELLTKVTKLDPKGQTHKVQLHVEQIFPTASVEARQTANTDRVVKILDIYDSLMDTEYAEKDAVNVNLDVQRYYHPSFTGNVIDEVKRHVLKEFSKGWGELKEKMRQLGLQS